MSNESNEPESNIITFCGEHAPRPDPVWQNKSPFFFIGRFVKIGFECDDEYQTLGRNRSKEHMWVEVTKFNPATGWFHGHLNNQPRYVAALRLHSEVEFTHEDIEDCAPQDGETAAEAKARLLARQEELLKSQREALGLTGEAREVTTGE